MGNCILRGFRVVEDMVKVVTPNGGMMELYAPITADCITNEFPGHAIFPSPRRVSPPLLHHEALCSGHYYYLLPLHSDKTAARDNSGGAGVPYRMSVDNQGRVRRQASEAEIPPRYNSGSGVWKVRLVINTDQLSEILSQEAHTEALIESVRTVAKCSAGVPADQRSWTTVVDNSAVFSR